MKFTDRQWLIIILLICLFYIFLRFWKLTDTCLWFDEIFSIHAAEHDWTSLYWFVAQDLIHPPLFYVLLKAWISLGGESLFWLRFLPVLFSILALLPFYFLCRQLKLNHSVIALSLIFLAANGALIKYSQEVRMYSLLFCLSLFSMWLFAKFFYLGKSLIPLTAVNVLLVYTHYFGWFVVLSEVIVIALFQRVKIRQILIMFASVFLGFIPWIVAIWQASKINSNVVQNIGWISKPNLAVIFQFVFDVIEPFYYQQSSMEAASKYLITIPLLLLIGAAKTFYLIDWKNETNKSPIYFLSAFIAIPVALAFTVSWLLPVSIWGSRHLIIVFAPALVLSAKFLTEIKLQPLKTAFPILIVSLFFFAFIFQLRSKETNFIWCGWENLAQSIDFKQANKIYVFEDLTEYHFWFTLRASPNAQIFKVKNVQGIREDTAYFLPRGFQAVKTVNENKMEGDKFWIAFRSENWDETKPPLRNLLDKGYKINEPKIYEVTGEKAFLILVEKQRKTDN
jgi:uncharacterized membrane protein